MAVRHVRAGGVELPIFVYCLEQPDPDCVLECDRTTVRPNPLALFILARRELRLRWVALGVAAWTGKPNSRAIKAAPFFFPPFRVVVLNENDDFFAGRPGEISAHLWRKFRGAVRERATRFGHLAAGGTQLAVNLAAGWVNLAAAALGNTLRFRRTRHLVRGAMAFPFAYFAQHNSGLSRWVFGQMRGTEQHRLTAPRIFDAGVVTFEYSGAAWDGAALEVLLARTESRWVLIQQAGEKGSVDDLMGLFSSERTFAVSRQTAYRGWQELLFPTAPFQALQPDEVTRVFAPYSNQILVDRAKLLALGIPRLSAPGSSFYLLFWQASAAGWSSYSAGGDRTIEEMPGVPFYEAQFTHALLLDRGLARLKPRDPSLAKGNITRAKTGGRGFRGLPRVLILSPYLPYPLSHGGAVRIFSLCQALANRVDFVLVCFREENDRVQYDKLHEVFREVFVVAVDEKRKDSRLPAQVCGYDSETMRALVPEVCLQCGIDLLQIEYTQMALYRETAPSLPAILVEHDITFTLYRQFADQFPSSHTEREYRSWLRFETERLRAFDQVWTMSDYDRGQAIGSGSDARKTITVPNGVDLRRFQAGERQKTGPAEILFVGSFRHLPNYLGFEQLRDQVMPGVWAEFPEVLLRVVAGPEHEKYWADGREIDPRIIVHGFVEDVAALYRECNLVVVPLPVSAGTNVKVMEALAAERAVVTTTVGCIGLGLRAGLEVAVHGLGAEFANAICELLRDPEKCRAMAKRGRETAEERFGWDRIANLAMAGYEQLLERANEVDGLERGRPAPRVQPERHRQHKHQPQR